MVETLTSTSKTCITVYSLKGNTIGILEKLDDKDYDSVLRITRNNIDEVKKVWKECSTILLGTSTYQRSDDDRPRFPVHLRHFQDALSELKDKRIILFGSGRGDYPMFCGGLDYLEKMLSVNNNVLLVYKFEGYPREHQKIEFKNKVEEIIYE